MTKDLSYYIKCYMPSVRWSILYITLIVAIFLSTCLFIAAIASCQDRYLSPEDMGKNILITLDRPSVQTVPGVSLPEKILGAAVFENDDYIEVWCVKLIDDDPIIVVRKVLKQYISDIVVLPSTIVK